MPQRLLEDTLALRAQCKRFTLYEHRRRTDAGDSTLKETDLKLQKAAELIS